jgi:hypothetical protein
VCGDATCTTKTLTVVDSAGDVGRHTSLGLNSSGFPVISYYDYTNQDLKVAVCGNATCTTKSLFVVDSAQQVGLFSSMKIRSDGRLFVSYYDATNQDLKLFTDDTLALPPSPTPTATFTLSITPTITPSATPSDTATFTATPSATPSATFTNTPAPPRPDTIGVYKAGVWYLRNTNNTGAEDILALFGGDASDLPVVGDWDGDGVDTIGVYRTITGFYFLSDSNMMPEVNHTFLFGNPGDAPFAGRWAADMTHDGIGVYRNSNGMLYAKKDLTTGFSEYFAIFGNPGDQAISGDWDSDGFDSIGIYRFANQRWYLSNDNTPDGITFSSLDFDWGIGNNSPVVGDWNGNGDSTVGFLTVTGNFVLHPNNATIGTDNVFPFGPTDGKPIAGRWSAWLKPPLNGVISAGVAGSVNNMDDGDLAD